MVMFTLVISCLTTSNLPWFMDLTFQVPVQHCSLQHRTLLPSPVTSTMRCCVSFGSNSSFFLELFLHWSPVAYWTPTNLGSSSFSVIPFCLFILFMGFSRQEYWSGFSLQWTMFCQKSPIKWTGMGNFNSDDHYIYYCGKESLRRNGVAIIVNKRVRNAVLGCNLKKDRMISVHFQANHSI